MKRKTPTWAIVLVLFCTILTTAAQVSWKYASQSFSFEPIAFILNYYMWLGFVFYGIGAALLLLALRHGELSTLYPLFTTTYVWVAIVSITVLGEELNLLKISGIFVIITGIVLIGKGSRQNDVETYESGGI